MRSWIFGVAAVLALAAIPASAQLPTRSLTPVPFNNDSPAQLAISLDQRQPVIGTNVTICFQSSKPGYATFWNISTANKVARIFPNQYSRVGPAAQIEGGKRYCAGTSGDPFRFRVDGPAGTEDLLLVWTTRPELQPTGTDYADAGALVGDMQRIGGATPNEWGTAKVTYDIVGPNGPERPPAPDPHVNTNVSSKVWIFATGANVKPLTKSNQDAAMFTTTVKKIFHVPDENIRFVENGKYADFVEAFRWLVDKAGPNDYVFVFFSGHGGHFPNPSSSDGQDEFLVPYDFETDPHADGRVALTSQRFAAMINQLQTKHVIAVIDACYSAGVYRSMEAATLGARQKYFTLPADVNLDQFRAQAQAADDAMIPRTRAAGGRGRIAANGLLLAAAKRSQEAEELSVGSAFTVALTYEMMGKEGGGTLMDMFGRAQVLTAKITKGKQDPEAVGDEELGRSISFESDGQ